ncbi:hypothetical protein [Streptomyces sp. NPDC007991]|uniref:hypothetical protein n=1 Tax=Streptomyces sp. NPDC007991 TaxID=3364803 RepID=UPI0036E0D2DC
MNPVPVAGRVGSRRTLAATATAVLLLAAVGAWALLPGEDGQDAEDGERDAAVRAAGAAPHLPSSPASAVTTGADGQAPGPSTIRPALATRLCVTEGHDRDQEFLVDAVD